MRTAPPPPCDGRQVGAAWPQHQHPPPASAAFPPLRRRPCLSGLPCVPPTPICLLPPRPRAAPLLPPPPLKSMCFRPQSPGATTTPFILPSVTGATRAGRGGGYSFGQGCGRAPPAHAEHVLALRPLLLPRACHLQPSCCSWPSPLEVPCGGCCLHPPGRYALAAPCRSTTIPDSLPAAACSCVSACGSCCSRFSLSCSPSPPVAPSATSASHAPAPLGGGGAAAPAAACPAPPAAAPRSLCTLRQGA